MQCHAKRKLQMVILKDNLCLFVFYLFIVYNLVRDCLRYMQEGSDFLKVRSYARQFRRLYKLNENFTAISWYPTTKKPSKATSSFSSLTKKRKILWNFLFFLCYL